MNSCDALRGSAGVSIGAKRSGSWSTTGAGAANTFSASTSGTTDGPDWGVCSRPPDCCGSTGSSIDDTGGKAVGSEIGACVTAGGTKGPAKGCSTRSTTGGSPRSGWAGTTPSFSSASASRAANTSANGSSDPTDGSLRRGGAITGAGCWTISAVIGSCRRIMAGVLESDGATTGVASGTLVASARINADISASVWPTRTAWRSATGVVEATSRLRIGWGIGSSAFRTACRDEDSVGTAAKPAENSSPLNASTTGRSSTIGTSTIGASATGGNPTGTSEWSLIAGRSSGPVENNAPENVSFSTTSGSAGGKPDMVSAGVDGGGRTSVSVENKSPEKVPAGLGTDDSAFHKSGSPGVVRGASTGSVATRGA